MLLAQVKTLSLSAHSDSPLASSLKSTVLEVLESSNKPGARVDQESTVPARSKRQTGGAPDDYDPTIASQQDLARVTLDSMESHKKLLFQVKCLS